ncbi:hypothetical protein GOP47_0018464 [Adiantum capillus-veneris]|uniref:Ethylene insensitive 3-like DNA-binding domain-containing protein n=1 Tax=Adiantum capillus-veneris TaxID=13818 RepID=A0A9D4UDG0_ADICA|nr:hypothetical protein GOP47_0018464 [Adiantum capillus-veneris]
MGINPKTQLCFCCPIDLDLKAKSACAAFRLDLLVTVVICILLSATAHSEKRLHRGWVTLFHTWSCLLMDCHDDLGYSGALDTDRLELAGDNDADVLQDDDFSDDDIDVDELEKRMWRDRIRLKRIKEQQKLKFQGDRPKQRQSQESARRKKMSRAQDGILKYMLKMMEVCNAQAFVYGIIPEKGKPVSGASDNIRAWWKEKVRFDRNGPAAIAKYQAEHVLNQEEFSARQQLNMAGLLTSHESVVTGTSGTFSVSDASEYDVEGYDDAAKACTHGGGWDREAVSFDPYVIKVLKQEVDVDGKIPVYSERASAAVHDSQTICSEKKRKYSGDFQSAATKTVYTCAYEQCPCSKNANGFSEVLLRNLHQAACAYRPDARSGMIEDFQGTLNSVVFGHSPQVHSHAEMPVGDSMGREVFGFEDKATLIPAGGVHQPVFEYVSSLCGLPQQTGLVNITSSKAFDGVEDRDWATARPEFQSLGLDKTAKDDTKVLGPRCFPVNKISPIPGYHLDNTSVSRLLDCLDAKPEASFFTNPYIQHVSTAYNCHLKLDRDPLHGSEAILYYGA